MSFSATRAALAAEVDDGEMADRGLYIDLEEDDDDDDEVRAKEKTPETVVRGVDKLLLVVVVVVVVIAEVFVMGFTGVLVGAPPECLSNAFDGPVIEPFGGASAASCATAGDTETRRGSSL